MFDKETAIKALTLLEALDSFYIEGANINSLESMETYAVRSELYDEIYTALNRKRFNFERIKRDL